MGERLELVEECEHGMTDRHALSEFVLAAIKEAAGRPIPPLPEEAICPGGSRRVLSGPTEEMVERGFCGAHSVTLVTEDGRPISVAGLLTLDHPELLEAVVRAALTAAFGSTTEEET